MSRRRTVQDWKRAVYRATQVSASVQVLLLLLADHMRDNRRVSVPRAQLAKELGIHEQRVAERIRAAVEHGYLSKVAGGYRGRTAEYQGLFPDECVPLPSTQTEPESIRATSTHSTPEIGTHSTPECVPDGGYATTTADLSVAGGESDDSSDEQPCRFHAWAACPDDCADHPANRRRTA